MTIDNNRYTDEHVLKATNVLIGLEYSEALRRNTEARMARLTRSARKLRTKEYLAGRLNLVTDDAEGLIESIDIG